MDFQLKLYGFHGRRNNFLSIVPEINNWKKIHTYVVSVCVVLYWIYVFVQQKIQQNVKYFNFDDKMNHNNNINNKEKKGTNNEKCPAYHET